jgi:hypothetical protein
VTRESASMRNGKINAKKESSFAVTALMKIQMKTANTMGI